MVACLVYLKTEQLFSRVAILFPIFINNVLLAFGGVTFFSCSHSVMFDTSIL